MFAQPLSRATPQTLCRSPGAMTPLWRVCGEFGQWSLVISTLVSGYRGTGWCIANGQVLSKPLYHLGKFVSYIHFYIRPTLLTLSTSFGLTV
jgi:hypothetical protein